MCSNGQIFGVLKKDESDTGCLTRRKGVKGMKFTTDIDRMGDTWEDQGVCEVQAADCGRNGQVWFVTNNDVFYCLG
jgi:hypothetical protein